MRHDLEQLLYICGDVNDVDIDIDTDRDSDRMNTWRSRRYYFCILEVIQSVELAQRMQIRIGK